MFKKLRNRFQGIDSKEAIPTTYVAWRAGAITLFVVRARQDTLADGISSLNSIPGPLKRLQIRAQMTNSWMTKKKLYKLWRRFHRQANSKKISFEVDNYRFSWMNSLLSISWLAGERAVVRVNGNYPAHYSKVSYIHGPNTIKTPNPEWRLYWCLIEFIDWKYSQSCIFGPSCKLAPL